MHDHILKRSSRGPRLIPVLAFFCLVVLPHFLRGTEYSLNLLTLKGLRPVGLLCVAVTGLSGALNSLSEPARRPNACTDIVRQSAVGFPIRSITMQ